MSGDKKVTLLKPSGAIIITTEKGVIEHDTKQCCHCGKHYIYNKNAGVTCRNCMDDTCGAPECDFCQPQELWLESEEEKARRRISEGK